MEAEGAVLPELDARGREAIAAPVRWTRHVTAREARVYLREGEAWTVTRLSP